MKKSEIISLTEYGCGLTIDANRFALVKFLWVSVDKTGLERDRKSETCDIALGWKSQTKSFIKKV